MQLKKRSMFITAILAGGLVLAACSSGTSSSTSSSAATSAAPQSSMAASSSAASPSMSESAAGKDIVALASETADLSTLVAAVKAAGLVETLQGEGPFTVFAPTNAAFDALPKGVLDALLLPENKEALTSILTYHVVPGAVMAADVKDGKVKTVEGSDLTLSTKDGVTVNGAKVVGADVVASNGVVHVIDAVLLPPDLDVDALLKK